MNNITIGSTVFGGWQVTKKIGHGAFSDVYRIDKIVGDGVKQNALKVIHVSENHQNLHYREQIEAEVSIMNKFMNHPNIVYFDDCQYLPDPEENGEDDLFLIKMELLKPLSRNDSHLSIDDILEIGINICTALQACEQRHVIHRDIKPQNIFFNPISESDLQYETGAFGARGYSVRQYELGDFGAAVLADGPVTGTAGTVPYMAPEVYNRKYYFHNADLYSLGLVLYQYLNNNCLPFMNVQAKRITRENKDLLEQANSLRFSGKKIPAIQGIDPKLNQILLTALAYDPGDRYQSADDLKRDLTSYKRTVLRSRQAEESAADLHPGYRDYGSEDLYGTEIANSNGGNTPYAENPGNTGATIAWNPQRGNNRYSGNSGNTGQASSREPGQGSNRYSGNSGNTGSATAWDPERGNTGYTEDERTGKKAKIALILVIITAIVVIAVVAVTMFLPGNGKFTIDGCNGMNVFSQEFADYEEVLKDHGYEVKIEADTTGNPSDAGVIDNYETSPNADSSKEDIVTYYYSTAPNVIGQTGEVAKQMLEAGEWKCQVEESGDCSSNPVEDGCVYAQELDEEDPATVIIYVYKANP